VRIRIGVVGLSDSWERRYKPALLRMSEKFDIRAVYDEVAYRGRVQASELECDAADGFTCLIERDDVDAVYLLGGSWLGLEPVQAACRANKAIFLGRPVGVDMPCADEVLQAVQSSDVRFMVEFPWRFYPATVRLMELLASGLGAPQLAFCEQHVFESEKRAWACGQTDAECNEVALHLADWMRFVFSQNPTHVESTRSHLTAGPSRGFETLIARFSESAIGQATVHRFLQPQWTEAANFRRVSRFQVIAQHGVAFLEMPGEITWFDQSGRHDESFDMDRPLGEMLSDRFYRIVRHGLNPSPGLSDAVWARRMIIDARHSVSDRSAPSALHRTAG
jgi:predicted dehydrogenase